MISWMAFLPLLATRRTVTTGSMFTMHNNSTTPNSFMVYAPRIYIYSSTSNARCTAYAQDTPQTLINGASVLTRRAFLRPGSEESSTLLPVAVSSTTTCKAPVSLLPEDVAKSEPSGEKLPTLGDVLMLTDLSMQAMSVAAPEVMFTRAKAKLFRPLLHTLSKPNTNAKTSPFDDGAPGWKAYTWWHAQDQLSRWDDTARTHAHTHIQPTV